MSKASRPLLMLLALSSLVFAQPNWVLNLTLQKGTTSIPLSIGGATTAADGFDATLDMLSPPPPPSTTDYFAYLEIVDPLFTMLIRDVRGWVSPYSATIEWKIIIMNSGGAQTTITWNQIDLPVEGTFICEGITSVNMRTANSATFTGDGTVYVGYSQAVSQTLSLNAGWNMISSYIDPPDSTLPTLLGPLGSHLTIAKNNGGQVYWPAYSINTIGKWNPLQGYICYLTTLDLLTFTGDPLIPESTPIDLVLGWNTVAYLRTSALSAPTALASIVSNLTIAKNMAGGVYWPLYSINTIGNLLPGQGYQLYVTAAVDLTYPANTLPKEARPDGTSLPSCVHFSGDKKLTGSNAILIWRELPFADGDEIAVLDGTSQMIGAGVVNSGQALLVVWGDDEATETKDGAVENEELVLRHWSRNENLETTLSPARITDALSSQLVSDGIRYVQDCALILEGIHGGDNSLPSEYQLAQNYPNPFNPATEIRFKLPKTERVKLTVYNTKGELVRLLYNEIAERGMHSVTWNGLDDIGRQVPGGIYFLQMSCDAFQQVIKMSFVK